MSDAPVQREFREVTIVSFSDGVLAGEELTRQAGFEAGFESGVVKGLQAGEAIARREWEDIEKALLLAKSK